jgi:hypothetical protein
MSAEGVPEEVGGVSMRLADALYRLAQAGGPDAPRAAAEWAAETGRIPAYRVEFWAREIQARRADLRTVESLAPVLGSLGGPVADSEEAEFAEFDALFPPATVEEAARRGDERRTGAGGRPDPASAWKTDAGSRERPGAVIAGWCSRPRDSSYPTSRRDGELGILRLRLAVHLGKVAADDDPGGAGGEGVRAETAVQIGIPVVGIRAVAPIRVWGVLS